MGVLLAIATAATVLQNVDWSHVTPQVVFGLIVALCTAFLGLLAKDPSEPDTVSITKSGKLGAWALIMLLLSGMFSLQGCTFSSAAIKADGQAVAQALQSVAAQLTLTDPSDAAKLVTAANTIASITANWNVGSGLTLFNDAANAAEEVLSVIPVTAPYAGLVSIAVVAIDTLVANANPSAVALRAEIGPGQTNLLIYRAMGKKLVHHRLLRSKAGDLKAAWNEEIKTANLQPLMQLK